MRWLFLLVLVVAGSCAPAPQPLVSQSVPDRPATLLRKLALDVPADVARTPFVATTPEIVSQIDAAPAFVDPARSLSDAERARDCLTAAIYYEARSEGVDGQRAVAQVVLNRVRDRAFPASVCGVVYQGSNRRTGCQFSFTCDGSMNRPRDPWSWERAGLVAAAALGGEVYAPVGSATHYHTTAISPWWAPSLTRLTTVGAHIFYRWPSGMERALAFRQQYAGYEPVVGGTSVTAGGVIAAFGTQQVNGVTIHRGMDEATATPVDNPTTVVASALKMQRVSYLSASGVRVHQGGDSADTFVADTPDASGVRVHRGVPSLAGDQPSRSPMPIEARAASASLETTG